MTDLKSQIEKFTLGFSPCPNDTFMFDAMVHQKIDTEGLEFDVVMEDVETLNQMAINGELDISKISFAAFTRITEVFEMLNSGSALGKGVGPLVVSRQSAANEGKSAVSSQQSTAGEEQASVGSRQSAAKEKQLAVGSWQGTAGEEEQTAVGRKESAANEGKSAVGSQQLAVDSREAVVQIGRVDSEWKFAIPGKNTTANFLFSIFFPEAKNKTEMIFSEIENAVLSGKVDAGVIIHESRFTYEQKGLKKICDLGELWEKETGQPIPLGGIAVKKNLPEEMKQRIDRVIKRSVEFAFANPESSAIYVKENAQEMDSAVSRKHIETYVNHFSVDLGEEGRNAIQFLFQKAKEVGLIHSIPPSIFVTQEIIPV
ncbi:MAG: 1,4-dihydroxy-6-naphthoate synthase [Bacteroidota bacterium]